jgi:hypothetical protein
VVCSASLTRSTAAFTGLFLSFPKPLEAGKPDQPCLMAKAGSKTDEIPKYWSKPSVP